MQSILPNSLIGSYTVLEEIGRGSFASVYLAKTPSDLQPVAIKSVCTGKLNKKLFQNLETEISILKSIQHPHIVGLLEILASVCIGVFDIYYRKMKIICI